MFAMPLYGARLIQVIETELEHRGCGHAGCRLANGDYGHGETFRRIKQYYSTDGTLLAEHDPLEGGLLREKLHAIAAELRANAGMLEVNEFPKFKPLLGKLADQLEGLA